MIQRLMHAIKLENISTIEELLEDDPSLVNTRDERGFTSLIMATYVGSIACTKHLLQHGADIDMVDATGNTALMGVTFKGDVEMGKLLIAEGADVNIVNKLGWSALHFSVIYHKPELTRLLLEAGADKSITDESGKSALDLATEKGYSAVQDVLSGN